MSQRNEPKQVTIIVRFLPQYRVDFFNGLRLALSNRGICLDLIYGKNSEVSRGDEVDLEWATALKNRTCRFGEVELYWQSVPKRVRQSDLVILMQENKMLNNYALLWKSLFNNRRRLAFWDHGMNLQAESNSLGNRFKRLYSTKVDWWFAYTEGVKQFVRQIGFPEQRITVVENAIDTRALVRESAKIGSHELDAFRRQSGLGSGPLGIYCGGMYKEKRIEFLLQACEAVRQRVPTFEMIFLGTGTDAPLVKAFCSRHQWAHYPGPLFGLARIPYFKVANVFLMPGALGLVILDAFALETPLVTTSFPYHGPEFEYLRHGENGILTADNLDDYVSGVIAAVSCGDLRTKLQEGCRRSASHYTVENMIGNFVAGTENALEAARWRAAA
jgi:L-malate glycosyltransferase